MGELFVDDVIVSDSRFQSSEMAEEDLFAKIKIKPVITVSNYILNITYHRVLIL